MISVIGTNDEVNGKEVMKMDARSRSAVSFMLVLLAVGAGLCREYLFFPRYFFENNVVEKLIRDILFTIISIQVILVSSQLTSFAVLHTEIYCFFIILFSINPVVCDR